MLHKRIERPLQNEMRLIRHGLDRYKGEGFPHFQRMNTDGTSPDFLRFIPNALQIMDGVQGADQFAKINRCGMVARNGELTEFIHLNVQGIYRSFVGLNQRNMLDLIMTEGKHCTAELLAGQLTHGGQGRANILDVRIK